MVVGIYNALPVGGLPLIKVSFLFLDCFLVIDPQYFLFSFSYIESFVSSDISCFNVGLFLVYSYSILFFNDPCKYLFSISPFIYDFQETQMSEL